MHGTLAQKAYDQIVEKMRRGDLPPDAQLVNRALAQELGMSAIPVREAISRLASEGLVTQSSGAGARVRQLDRQELAELFGLREALETYAAAEAARHITEPELAALAEVCRRFRTVAGSLRKRCTLAAMRRWLDCEEDFHALLIAAARNRWLSRTVARLRLLASVFHPLRRKPELLTPSNALDTCRDHEQLLAALAAHDSHTARQTMQRQLQAGHAGMLQRLYPGSS